MAKSNLTIRLHVLTQKLEAECPECLFSSMVKISTVQLLETGVKTWFEKTACVRCEDMKSR